MPFPVPTSLSPSRVEAFTSCPLAFRFASIERLPEPPSVAASKGTLVHKALELLFLRPGPERTPAAAVEALATAVDLLRDDPEFTLLDLDDEGRQAFRDDAERLVRSYFELEDPTTVREIGLELRLEAKVGPLALRGIIDRLELDEHGGLVVTDYKTGKAPSANYEQRRLGGVQFYAFLCQEVFGRRPSAVQLLYLGSGEAIIARPTEQSVAYLPKRTAAVWRAVEKACADGDFRPRIGPLCNFCGFKQWCPAHGGDPDRALLEAPVAYAQGPVQLPLAAV